MTTPTPATGKPAATAKGLFDVAFSMARDPRSTAYKAGVMAALKFRVDGIRIYCPYEIGSAENDAFYAGITEGHAIWRKSQEQA